MIFLEKFKKIGKKPLKMEKCLFFRILCVKNTMFYSQNQIAKLEKHEKNEKSRFE